MSMLASIEQLIESELRGLQTMRRLRAIEGAAAQASPKESFARGSSSDAQPGTADPAKPS